MKINTYFLMLLIILIASVLFLNSKKEQNEVIFIEAKKNIESRDTIKLFEVIDGKEKEHFMDFRFRETSFKKDSFLIFLSTGVYGLQISVIGNEYTSSLFTHSHTGLPSKDLVISEQTLEIEDLNLMHNEKLKGNYYCVANFKNNSESKIEEINIRGFFESNLIAPAEQIKNW